eukprot:3235003-Amphidinium_carterae.1
MAARLGDVPQVPDGDLLGVCGRLAKRSGGPGTNLSGSTKVCGMIWFWLPAARTSPTTSAVGLYGTEVGGLTLQAQAMKDLRRSAPAAGAYSPKF